MYGNLNVAAFRNRVHSARVPSNLPGPIYPGVGPGSWHSGPSVAVRPSYGADSKKAALGAVGLGLIGAALLVPTFVVGPFIVKAFAPDWSYGRRLGASLAFGVVTGAAVRLAQATTGKK